MTAKELREKRNELVPQIKEMADREQEWQAEDRQAWEKINEDYNELSRQIEETEQAEGVAQRMTQIEEDQQRRVGDPDAGRDNVDHRSEDRGGGAGGDGAEQITPEHRALAMQAWCRTQTGDDLSDAQREACERTGFNPNRRNLDFNLTRDYRECRRDFWAARRESRAMSAVDGSAGAFLEAPAFVPQLEVALLQHGGTRQVADVMRTDSGAEMPWPTSDDTSNTGALLGENTVVTEQNVAVGQVVFRAYKFSSKLVKVPSELLQDSAFDLVSFLATTLGTRLGRIQNTYFTTGDGASQPYGIVEASTLGVTAAGSTAITADETLDLVHSVDPAYRQVGCGWMFHDTVLLALRKLKDGEGRYIWQSGMAGGQPDTLWSFPITINQSMASSIASAAKTMLFGQLNKYKIRDVASIRLRRLVERYADYDQEGFVAFMRGDGNLLDAGTHPVKHMLQT